MSGVPRKANDTRGLSYCAASRSCPERHGEYCNNYEQYDEHHRGGSSRFHALFLVLEETAIEVDAPGTRMVVISNRTFAESTHSSLNVTGCDSTG